MTRLRYVALAGLVAFLSLTVALRLGAQTLGTPVAVRADSTVSGTASVLWPATYDSSRAIVTNCAQVRVAGVTKTAVCRTKTGPWVRHVVALPPPPPPPPAATLTLTIEGDPAVGSWAVRATPVGFTAARVTFSIDGTPYSTEGSAAYCLFGGDGPCTRSTLSPGSHVIRAAALSSLGAVLANASVTVVQGTAPPADSALRVAAAIIYPKSIANLPPGTGVQFCQFIRFADGATAMRDQDSAGCAGYYAAMIAKRPSAAQQTKANGFCWSWAAAGGQIVNVPEVCPGGTLGMVRLGARTP